MRGRRTNRSRIWYDLWDIMRMLHNTFPRMFHSRSQHSLSCIHRLLLHRVQRVAHILYNHKQMGQSILNIGHHNDHCKVHMFRQSNRFHIHIDQKWKPQYVYQQQRIEGIHMQLVHCNVHDRWHDTHRDSLHSRHLTIREHIHMHPSNHVQRSQHR